MPSTSLTPLNIYSLSLRGCTSGFDSKVGEKWFDSGADQLPVNDSVPVQEHQSRRDLGSVKTRPRLVELPRALNLKHQVASIDVLHHKEQPVLWRKVELESAQSVF